MSGVWKTCGQIVSKQRQVFLSRSRFHMSGSYMFSTLCVPCPRTLTVINACVPLVVPEHTVRRSLAVRPPSQPSVAAVRCCRPSLPSVVPVRRCIRRSAPALCLTTIHIISALSAGASLSQTTVCRSSFARRKAATPCSLPKRHWLIEHQGPWGGSQHLITPNNSIWDLVKVFNNTY